MLFASIEVAARLLDNRYASCPLFQLTMKVLALFGFLLLGVPSFVPASAQVSLIGHEQCLKAADYKGCMDVYAAAAKNKFLPSTQNIKLNIDTQVTSDGNECPSEFAYAGAGYCRRVICVYGGLLGLGHHPDLAGKGVGCFKGRGEMRWASWDTEKVRASYNPKCPDIPFEIGYQSTCYMNSLELFSDIASEKYVTALPGLQKAYDLNKRDWVNANNYGVVLIEIGRPEEAIAPLRNSLKAHNHSKIRLNLAIALYLSSGLQDEVFLLARDSLKEEPRYLSESFQKQEYFGPRSRMAIKAIYASPELSGSVKNALRGEP